MLVPGLLIDCGDPALPDAPAVLRWSREHLTRLAFTPEQVIAAAVPSHGSEFAWHTSGIYFLVRRGRISYIGRANVLSERLRQHRGRPFDAVTAIAGVPHTATPALEHAYVEAWQPSWNSARTHAGPFASEPLQRALAAMPRYDIDDEEEHVIDVSALAAQLW
jgi:hypothetical protein